MTDSSSGPGGPASLKFASLSVQSYQLDSPPFTGAAVGGPSSHSGTQDHDNVSSPVRKSIESTSVSLPPASEADPAERGAHRQNSSDMARSRTETKEARLVGDADLPDWRLDRHERKISQRKELGPSDARPAYTVLAEDMDGIEDATSVITEREFDEEVDGDDVPFVLRRTASSTHRVPVQPQSKVRTGLAVW